MKKWAVVLLLLLSHIGFVSQASSQEAFRFFAASYPFLPTNSSPSQAIKRINETNSAFVVVNGFRATHEPCNDKSLFVYKHKLNTLRIPVMLSMADYDWANCKNNRGLLVSKERLMRIREILLHGRLSLGGKPKPVYRESITGRFSNYPENAYWQKGGILFATVHLPASNNLYQADAGRNNEFEDRTIANKYWMNKLTRIALQNHTRAIVIFSDGNPFAENRANRDGFEEIKQTTNSMLSQYNKPILWVVGKPATFSEIRWYGHLGIARIGYGWSQINVSSGDSPVFSVNQPIR